ncbi:MAG: PD-(D/E)XK nuclease family protein [Acidobacteriota bacterium]|nr:MAG: PD-(D/E)XK nuclease family protein [Acidobacteriota bacterium]
MSCKLIHGYSFRELKGRLFDSLADLTSSAPLKPKWLLVPNSTTAARLRVELAGAALKRPLGNVRLLTLSHFSSRLIERAFGVRPDRWNTTLDLLLYQVLERAGGSPGLRALQALPAGHGLVKPTFLDLADGGFGRAQEDLLLELASEPDLSELESGVLKLYCHWLETLEAAEIDWEPLTQQRLADWLLSGCTDEELFSALACEQDMRPSIFLYGFYDFTDVNLQLVAALGRRTELQLFYPAPRSSGPAFEFCEPILDDLRARLGSAFESEGDGGTKDLAPATAFFRKTFPEGQIPSRPDFLTFQRVSGVRAEALSAAVRVSEWLENDPGLSPEDILVITPSMSLHFPVLTEVFENFAIPIRCAEVRRDQAEPPDCIDRLQIFWREQASLEWLLGYLRDFPAVATRWDVEIDHFETELRRLPVSGGSSWVRLKESLMPEAGNVRPVEFTTAEIRLISELVDLWVLGTRERSVTLTDAVELLTKAAQWLEDAGEFDGVIGQLSEASAFLEKLTFPVSLLWSFVRQSFDRGSKSDSLNERGVLLAPVMRARGLTPKAMVFLGLSSSQFPSGVTEDPFLTDSSRQKLIAKLEQIGFRLPVKQRATDEMALLFFLMNTCAEKVHWVIPETDDDGRTVAATPWVLRYLQHWQELKEPLPRIQRSPAEQHQYLYGLDRLGRRLPPAFSLVPRSGGGISDSCPGLIRSAAGAYSAGGQIRVTQLEQLARCPFRFWAASIARLTVLSPKLAAQELDGMAKGSLAHAFLEQVLSKEVAGGDELSDRVARITAWDESQWFAVFDRLDPIYLVALKLLPPLIAKYEKGQVVKLVKRYLHSLDLTDLKGRVTVGFEFPVKGSLPSLAGLAVRGRIDRIDRCGNGVWIVDYKTGGLPFGKTKFEKVAETGFLLQPALYRRLFAAGEEEESLPTFNYVYLGVDPPQTIVVTGPDDLEGVLAELWLILSEGTFLPTSTDLLKELAQEKLSPCSYCEFPSLCRRFAVTGPKVSVQALSRWMPGRVLRLSGQGGSSVIQ